LSDRSVLHLAQRKLWLESRFWNAPLQRSQISRYSPLFLTHSELQFVQGIFFFTKYYCIAKAMRSKIFNFPTQPITGQNMKLPQTWVIKPTFQSSWVSYSHQKFVFDGCVYDFFRAQIACRQAEKKKNIQYTKCLPVLSVGRERKNQICINYRVV
jgi:hypothetical protein